MSIPDNVKPLTPVQNKLLQQLWKDVEAGGDIMETGILLYKRLFSQTPEVMKMFRFVDTDDFSELETRPRFQRHALNVINTVGVAISALDDLEALYPILYQLGYRHLDYGTKISHYDLVGEALTYAVQMRVGSKLSGEVLEAWRDFYNLVTEGTKNGLVDAAKYYEKTDFIMS